jgi:hypothetical protein
MAFVVEKIKAKYLYLAKQQTETKVLITCPTFYVLTITTHLRKI